MPRSSTGKIFNALDGLRATISVSVLGNTFLSQNKDNPEENLKNALLAVAITETIVNVLAIMFACANLLNDSLLYFERLFNQLPTLDTSLALIKMEAGKEILPDNKSDSEEQAVKEKLQAKKTSSSKQVVAQNTKNYVMRIGKSFARILLALFGLTGAALLFSDLDADHRNENTVALIGIWFIATSLTTSKTLSYFPTDNPGETTEENENNITSASRETKLQLQ